MTEGQQPLPAPELNALVIALLSGDARNVTFRELLPAWAAAVATLRVHIGEGRHIWNDDADLVAVRVIGDALAKELGWSEGERVDLAAQLSAARSGPPAPSPTQTGFLQVVAERVEAPTVAKVLQTARLLAAMEGGEGASILELSRRMKLVADAIREHDSLANVPVESVAPSPTTTLPTDGDEARRLLKMWLGGYDAQVNGEKVDVRELSQLTYDFLYHRAIDAGAAPTLPEPITSPNWRTDQPELAALDVEKVRDWMRDKYGVWTFNKFAEAIVATFGIPAPALSPTTCEVCGVLVDQVGGKFCAKHRTISGPKSGGVSLGGLAPKEG